MDNGNEKVSMEEQNKEVESPKNLIEVYLAVSELGEITVSAQNSADKSGVSMGIVRDVLQKALNRVNDDVLQACVNMQIKKLVEGNKLTKPGFRPSVWERLIGK